MYHLIVGCFFVIISVVLIEDWFGMRSTLCKETEFNWISEKSRSTEDGSNIVRRCGAV